MRYFGYPSSTLLAHFRLNVGNDLKIGSAKPFAKYSKSVVVNWGNTWLFGCKIAVDEGIDRIITGRGRSEWLINTCPDRCWKHPEPSAALLSTPNQRTHTGVQNWNCTLCLRHSARTITLAMAVICYDRYN